MFDFLSNISNTVKNAVSSAKNYITSTFTPSSQTANVMNFRVGEGLDPAQKQVAQSVVSGNQLPQQSVAPNVSTVLGPAYASGNTYKYNTVKGVASVPSSSLPSSSTPYYAANPQLLSPSLTVKNQSGQSYVTQQQKAPTVSTVRQSTAPTVYSPQPNLGYNQDFFTASGIPLDRKNGTPIYGETGQSGISTSNIGVYGPSSITGGNGSSGSGGFTVGGNPLGLLNAGLVGINGENDKEKNGLFSPIKFNPTTNKIEGGMIGSVPSPYIPGVTQSIASRLFSNAPEKPLQVPTIPSIQSSENLRANITKSTPAISSSLSSSKNDFGTMTEQAKAAIDAGVTDRMQKLGLTPEKTVVEDSPEFQDFMSQLDQNTRFDYQQFADNFRTSSGMSDWMKLKESSLSALQTATQYYDDIVKEIKSNPDLPKAIQNQRVQMMIDQKNSVITKARADMEMAQNAISDINTALNQQLGIVTAQRSEDDKKRQMNLDIFKTLLENGTEFTLADKAQWSAMLGVPTSTLDKLVAKSKDTDKFQSADGVIYQFRPNAQGQLELYKTYGTSASSSSGNGSIPVSNKLRQELEMVIGGAGGSVNAQNNARNYISELYKSGDTKTAESYINSLAVKGLPAAQKQQFVSTGVLSNDIQAAIDSISSIEKSNPGLYKNLSTTIAPFLNQSRDQSFVAAKALIDGFQAQRINDLYGAALTGGELARANNFFIDMSRDDIATIKTKLTGLLSTANRQRTSLLNEAKFNFDQNGNVISSTDNQQNISQTGSQDSGSYSDTLNSLTGGTSQTSNTGGGLISSVWNSFKNLF